jgi:hypothetical protein
VTEEGMQIAQSETQSRNAQSPIHSTARESETRK